MARSDALKRGLAHLAQYALGGPRSFDVVNFPCGLPKPMPANLAALWRLQSFTWVNHKLSNEDLVTLAGALGSCSNLRILKLPTSNKTGIGEDGHLAVAKAVPKWTRLTHFDMSSSSFSAVKLRPAWALHYVNFALPHLSPHCRKFALPPMTNNKQKVSGVGRDLAGDEKEAVYETFETTLGTHPRVECGDLRVEVGKWVCPNRFSDGAAAGDSDDY